MKKKILGIFVCMLLIATAIPAVGTIVNDNLTIRETSDDYNNLIQQIIGNSCSLGGWGELDKLTASDGATDDNFGYSVSIDGDYALIGAAGDDDNGELSGSAYVFKRSGTTWAEEQKLTASDGALGDVFGWSVAIDGDYALIGAFLDDDNGESSGSAYVFKRTGTTWAEEQKLNASDGEAGDYFGRKVSIDGDYALIGAWGDDDNGLWSGSAYVFKRSGTTWAEEQKLTASDGATDDCFGTSVSINGDYALIGGPYNDDNGESSGSAYVFKRTGTTWAEEQKLNASDGATEDRFGFSGSIDGDYALIGAIADDSLIGSVYVFKRTGTTWAEEQKLTASDGATEDRFGGSVSIDGDYALIGAHGDDVFTGSAYVFKRSGTTWAEEQKLTASDGATDDYFGFSVSIDGDYAFIGAYGDDAGTGSAYMFKKLIPHLDCWGSLSWTDISPGATVTGSFNVSNIGEPTSELNWNITEWPPWGTWTFNPSSGNALKPEDGPVTVQVTVVSPQGVPRVIPHPRDTTYEGQVKIVNLDDPSDFCTIDVSLTTPKNKAFNINLLFLRFLEQHPNMFPIIRHILGL